MPVSFDLAVLAPTADMHTPAVREMFDRCVVSAVDHRQGEADDRITAFYGELQAIYPDHGPAVHEDTSPWSSTPHDVGIDHVFMQLRHGSASASAVEVILSLASRHRLTVYDPQSDDAYFP